MEKGIRTLYLDYQEQLLDKEDYKKFYQEKLNEKNRIKTELEMIKKQEIQRTIISEDKMNEFIEKIFNMKEPNRELISEIVQDIQIDQNNTVYIYYRYDILKVVA